jgi:hypothetical protein
MFIVHFTFCFRLFFLLFLSVVLTFASKLARSVSSLNLSFSEAIFISVIVDYNFLLLVTFIKKVFKHTFRRKIKVYNRQ